MKFVENWLIKLTYNFVVHSNESAGRKIGHLVMDPKISMQKFNLSFDSFIPISLCNLDHRAAFFYADDGLVASEKLFCL